MKDNAPSVMKAPILHPRLYAELKAALDQGLASGDLMMSTQIAQHLSTFRERFGPAVLGRVDGEELLRFMHGRQDTVSRCLAYWLEFKNDEEFTGNQFGGIAGGSAMKFGIYQRQTDGAWMGGSHAHPDVISLKDAIAKARQQRDELLAGSSMLAGLNLDDISDEAYARIQAAMENVAPDLSGDGWAHKYWFLLHSDRLDDYHSPRHQRFHRRRSLELVRAHQPRPFLGQWR